MKPPFLNSPQSYTKAPRQDWAPGEYACSIEHTINHSNRLAGYAVAVALTIGAITIGLIFGGYLK